mmetsp:Transcript_16357/g.34234  ORF Transcript_16357/g.34234 Transcript_16357/m.34234 type:complete len:345 (-) Transcript_16357:207-1241(-)
MLPSTLRTKCCLLRIRATARTQLISLRNINNGDAPQKSPPWTQQRILHKQKTQTFHHKRTTTANNMNLSQKSQQLITPYFGIVAALTKNNIIGVDHSLPWNFNAANNEAASKIKNDMIIDRNHFTQLTKNRIIILGRKSFLLEDPTGKHVEHARMCIVISRSLGRDEITRDWNLANIQGGDENGDRHAMHVGPVVKVVRSFREALDLARDSSVCENRASDNYHGGDGVHEIIDADQSEDANLQITDNRTKPIDSQIDFWVCGGENVFAEALCHPLAVEAHLTHVDMILDVDNPIEKVINRNDNGLNQKSAHIAYFPINLLKENTFEEVSRRVHGICAFSLYKKR